MSFLPGTSMRVLAGTKDVSGWISGANAQHQRATSDVTVVTSGGGMNYVPALMSGALALRGPAESDGLLQAAIQAAVGVDNNLLVTVLPDGTAVGKPALFCLGDPTEYTEDASVSDALGMVVTATADESVDMGYVLTAPTALTATTNGTTVDRGTSLGPGPVANSQNGGMAALHVTAFSGFTSVAIKIQHSTDNSSWSDLSGGAFTAVTALSSARLLIPRGTQVNRYVRAVTTVTGSGSITYLMAFAPR